MFSTGGIQLKLNVDKIILSWEIMWGLKNLMKAMVTFKQNKSFVGCIDIKLF